MKKFLIVLLITISICANIEAALIDKNSSIAVMDMGTNIGTSDLSVYLFNVEKSSSEYIIQRLIEQYKLNVVDKDLFIDKLKMENLDTTGLIDPDTAKRIGEILNVKYLIYGKVVNVSVAEDENGLEGLSVKSRTVKANIVARIMEVNTGRIIMAAKGEGKSKSAHLSFTDESFGEFLTIGNVKVSQDSVHNALQKAAFQVVDILIERLK